MGTQVQKLVTEDSFVNGVLVPAGDLATYDSDQLNGKEPHIHDAGEYVPVTVEMSAISPTGPNPQVPQQISPDTVQGPGGGYQRPGAIIVAEKTDDADTRLRDRLKEGDTSEGDFAEQLRELEAKTAELRAKIVARTGERDAATQAAARAIGAGALVAAGALAAAAVNQSTTENTDDALVAGTVADITSSLADKDDAELEAIRAAEVDREKPRKGVLDAIKAEQEKRASA